MLPPPGRLTTGPATWPTVARVALVRLFPLKSGAEQNPPRARLDLDGLVGDRGWAVVDASGAVLRPRHHPDLARLSLDAPAAGDPAPPRVLLDGRDPVDPAALLGVPGARLVAVRGVGDPGAVRAALHLVGADAAHDPGAPAGADPGRRANLVLTGLPPGAERSWVGARLRAGGDGGALLEVTSLPRRCLGVYATVLRPGRVGVGDPVALEPAGTGGRPRPAADDQ